MIGKTGVGKCTNEKLNQYKEIKLGDLVRRIEGTYKPPVNVEGYGPDQEGIVVDIEKTLPTKNCVAQKIGEKLCFCEKHIRENPVWLYVARDGDEATIQLMSYDQVEKIEKDFPRSINGKMKMF